MEIQKHTDTNIERSEIGWKHTHKKATMLGIGNMFASLDSLYLDTQRKKEHVTVL